MRLFYFDRVAEILHDEVVMELQKEVNKRPTGLVQQDQDIIQELVVNKLRGDLDAKINENN